MRWMKREIQALIGSFGLQEKASHVKSLHEEEKFHGSPFHLAARIFELESPMEIEKKYPNKATTAIVQMKSCANKVMGALQHEKEFSVKDHEAYEEWVVGLRNKVVEALQQTLTRVYESFDQATDQVETLHPNIPIPRSQLNSHKVIRDEALEEDDNASPQGGDA